MKTRTLIPAISLLIGLVVSCNQVETVQLSDKLFIVIDKSQSVTFSDQLPFGQIIKGKLIEVYGNQQTTNRLKVGWIEDHAGVSTYDYSEPYPTDDPSTVTGSIKIAAWTSARSKWFNQLADTLSKEIKRKPTASTTDIFEMVRSIDQQKLQLAEGEKLDVLFFSDMIHDTKDFNLRKSLDNSTPAQLAVHTFQQMGLDKRNSAQVSISIMYTYNADDYNKFKTFWEHFFAEWGMHGVDFEYLR